MRYCPDCKTEKPITEFSKNAGRKDGLQRYCRDHQKARLLRSYYKHKKKTDDRNKAHRCANLEMYAAYQKRFREAHPHEVRVYSKYYANVRRCNKLQATPKWLTEEQLKHTYEIYNTCPPGYHVDHIVPLKGRNVSGLHVPWNLQHLPAAENIKKFNKF